MIYLLLFFISFIFTYFIKNYSIKNSLIAKVESRSSHTVPTPHGGGIAIAISWFIGLIYLYYSNNIDTSLYYALLTGIIISFVSYLDDLFDLSAKTRLSFQSLVAVLGLIFLDGLTSLNFGIITFENQLITNIFAFFLIIWFINLYNFLDGIDGYAGIEAVFLGLAGFMIYGGEHFLILVVSVLGFLFWNWHKAKIFMGDVGSTLLGYNIAIFTIYYSNDSSENFWIWIILFGLFLFDATLTLFRRFINKEKLTQAHKKHGYQRLVQSGWSHFKVTNYSIGLNIVLFSIVYFISNVFIALLISFIILTLIMKFVEIKKKF